jgi:hypothetical protein
MRGSWEVLVSAACSTGSAAAGSRGPRSPENFPLRRVRCVGTSDLIPRLGGMWTYRLPFGALVGLSGVAFFVGLMLH